MKKLSMEDIRKLSTEELIKQSQQLKDEIAETKRHIHLNEAQNPRAIRVKRRQLARMLTVLSEQLTKERA